MTFCKLTDLFGGLNCLNFTLFHHANHKVLTYIEYRAVSGVFRTIDPPPPLPPASVSSHRTKGEVVPTRWPVRGWGVNISEDARHWIGLLQYNPSTMPTLPQSYTKFWLTRASLLLTTCIRTDRLTYRHRCDWNTAEIQSGRQTGRQTYWQWQTTNRHTYRHINKHRQICLYNCRKTYRHTVQTNYRQT
jgi:hypothetical protein